MRLVRLTPPALMLLMSACSQAPLLAPASPSGVVVDAHAGNGRTAVVSVQSAERALQAVGHHWTARDISEYDVTLKVKNGASYGDPTTGPLTAVLPVVFGAPAAPTATFANLRQGLYYRAFVTAKGCQDGSCAAGAAVTMNGNDTGNYADFDFSATQDTPQSASGTVTVHFDDVAFSGTGGLTFASPTDGSFTSPTGAPIPATLYPGTTIGTYAVGANPQGVAVDSSGHVWVANYGGSTVTELSSTGSVMGTFTVGLHPYAVAFDGSGNVWVTNSSSDNVMKLSSVGGFMATYSVLTPYGVAVDPSGNVWVASDNRHAVVELSNSGGFIHSVPVGTTPRGVAVDGNGNVWVTNNGSRELSHVISGGGLLATASLGSGALGVAVDANGNVWVAESDGVVEFSSAGAKLGSFTAGYGTPVAVAIDGNGHVWVTNTVTGYVTELSDTGSMLGSAQVGANPQGVAVDTSGHVWVANGGSGYVSKLLQ